MSKKDFKAELSLIYFEVFKLLFIMFSFFVNVPWHTRVTTKIWYKHRFYGGLNFQLGLK